MSLLKTYKNIEISTDEPVLLFEKGEHKVYWLGIDEDTAFRCNVYMIVDGDQAVVVDPGNRLYFETVKEKVAKVIDPEKVIALILCHQDPDVSASIIDWYKFNENIKIITSARTNVLLPHYGISGYDFYDISSNDFIFQFKSGRKLQFVESPFLHFPGAFTTLDLSSEFLFSGDIWAALDTNWKLVVDDFSMHESYMDLFHLDYMASNIAARGFVKRLEGKRIEAILPQHGSLIDKENVQNAIEYLENLQCGTDIIYSEID